MRERTHARKYGKEKRRTTRTRTRTMTMTSCRANSQTDRQIDGLTDSQSGCQASRQQATFATIDKEFMRCL